MLLVLCLVFSMPAAAFAGEQGRGASAEKTAGTKAAAQVQNALSNAASVSLNTKYQGRLTEDEEADIYKFTLPSSGKINLKGTAGIKELELKIFDVNGEKVWRDTDYWNSTTQQIPIDYDLELTSGTYYLSMGGWGYHTGSYDFSLNFTSAGESFAETAGGSNNSLASAETISLGKDYKGQIALNDELDYYKFNMTFSGKINMKGTVHTERVGLTIFDAAGTEIWDDEPRWNSTTQQIELDYDVHLTAGTYYLCVERYYGSYAGNYDFRLGFTSAEESFPETAGGSNNSLASAETVSLGKDYKGQIALNDELDYYKFNMTFSGKINMKGTVHTERVGLTIFDAAGTEIWDDEPRWNSTTQQIELDYDVHLTAGTYYLCVERYYDSYAGNYDFRLDFTSAGESFPETKDDNDNSLAAANQISLSKTYKGQIAENDNKDFYRFTLSKAGKIQVTANAYTDLYLYLYDASGEEVDEWWERVDSSTGKWTDKRLIKLGKAGTYYLCAERYYDRGNYSFSVAAFTPKITVKSSFTATAGGSSFDLNAKVNDDSEDLTYTSSNKKVVTVSSYGYVYIEGPGTATITVGIKGLPVKKSVKVTVYPKKGYLSSVKTGKGYLKASWYRDSQASGYQVLIARDSKFTKSKKSAAITKNSSVSKTFSKLKRKATYYVKVRSYKTVGKTKLYGAYSSAFKVKTK